MIKLSDYLKKMVLGNMKVRRNLKQYIEERGYLSENNLLLSPKLKARLHGAILFSLQLVS